LTIFSILTVQCIQDNINMLQSPVWLVDDAALMPLTILGDKYVYRLKPVVILEYREYVCASKKRVCVVMRRSSTQNCHTYLGSKDCCHKEIIPD
jgi:hypothetical protein